MKTSSAAAFRTQALNRAMETIDRRVNALGVTEPTIAEYGQGDLNWLCTSPGGDDPTRVHAILESRPCWS